jgi:ketosteroid isomerase-like protein
LSLSIEDLAGQYHQGWADRDPDVIVALHTENTTFHMHGVANPAVGRARVRELVASLLALVPDLRFEGKRFYLGANHIVFEYDMSGTTSGSKFVCDGADVIAVESGLVARKDTYLDLVALVDQIGALPDMVVGVATR